MTPDPLVDAAVDRLRDPRARVEALAGVSPGALVA